MTIAGRRPEEKRFAAGKS